MKTLFLVGNPNSGKTTFFNRFTCANEHVGNWHGVTIECKHQNINFDGQECDVVDTPGIYSLTPFSFEEEETIKILRQNKNCKIINICDRDNLKKNLYLSLCLLEEGFDVLIAVNCTKKNPCIEIDLKKFEGILGVGTCLFDASKEEKKKEVFDFLKTEKRKVKLDYFDDSFLSLPFEKQAQARFDFIDKILQNCCRESGRVYGKSRFDKIVLNKFFALPIFLFIMFAVFFLTFFVFGKFFSNMIESVIDFVSNPFLKFLEKYAGKTWIFDLFDVAIFGGMKTILSFLPQIVLLLFFLSILEESGYLSRVAFMFDDLLSKVGLSGKAVYSLLMGFGCSTSAIMTAKLADDKNAKIKTAMLCPYMSCSAKIPIYAVVGGAFFGACNVFVVFGLYLLGVFISVLLSVVLEKTILKSKNQTFILEFPPYRKISLKKASKSLLENSKQFLSKVGSILLCMNVVVFVLSSFSFSFRYVGLGGGESILEKIAGVLSFVFVPLGFGSKSVCAVLLSGFVAKEVIVSSIAMFNGIDVSSNNLISNSLSNPQSPIFFATGASAISFLVYCLLYTPCLSSILMLNKEIGKKWTIVAVLIQLFVAYIVCLVVYNIVLAFEIFGFLPTFLATLCVLIFMFAVAFIARSLKKRKVCAFCRQCDNKCDKDF